MNKIIFINRFFFPDQSATSQILSDLLFNIVDRIDLEIHVVTSQNTYQNDARLESFEKYNNINIHRVWTTRFGRKNLIGRAIDYFSFYLSTFVALMRLVKKDDVIVAKTDPPVISFVAYLVSKIKKAYLINWIQDLFPEVASGLNIISTDSVIYKLLKWIKNKSLKAADMNVVIGRRMHDLLLEEGISKDNIAIIDNWNINEDAKYINKEDNYLIVDWELQNKFIVAYSGNFGRAHEYEVIRKLVDQYKQDPSLVFLFIGGGKYYDDIKKYTENKLIKNVIFKPYQDKDKLNYSLSLADIHVISLRPELEGLIVPSKFYGLASIGAPILFIGDNQGEISQIINKYNCGFSCGPDEEEKIYQHIDEVKFGKMDTKLMSENLKKLYDTAYRPEVAYNKWLRVLEKYVHA